MHYVYPSYAQEAIANYLKTNKKTLNVIESVNSSLKKVVKKRAFLNENDLNIGGVVCHFGTSLEEFLAFFMHPPKGYIFHKSYMFKNFDAIIFFSMTATPDLFMEEIYSSYNLFSILTSKRISLELLKTFRFDNVFADNGRIFDEVIPYTKELYGKYILQNFHGILSFFREDATDERKDKYCSEIAKKLNTDIQ